jgi:hypothetical protein
MGIADRAIVTPSWDEKVALIEAARNGKGELPPARGLGTKSAERRVREKLISLPATATQRSTSINRRRWQRKTGSILSGPRLVRKIPRSGKGSSSLVSVRPRVYLWQGIRQAHHRVATPPAATPSFATNIRDSGDVCQHPSIFDQHGLYLEARGPASFPVPHSKLLPVGALCRSAIQGDMVTPMIEFGPWDGSWTGIQKDFYDTNVWEGKKPTLFWVCVWSGDMAGVQTC